MPSAVMRLFLVASPMSRKGLGSRSERRGAAQSTRASHPQPARHPSPVLARTRPPKPSTCSEHEWERKFAHKGKGHRLHPHRTGGAGVGREGAGAPLAGSPRTRR